MDLATGAMGTLLPKLLELLGEEYKLQKGVREGVKSLEKEMRSMHAALCKVAEVPRDQLDKQVKLWAGEVRELSFDMEDVVDKFLVHVDDGSEPAAKSDRLKRLTKKMVGLFSRGKARHEIADAIEVINKQVKGISDRRARYNIDNIVGRPAAVTLDPLLRALYTEVTELVGIKGKRDQELTKLVLNEDNGSEEKLKIVSVVGFGGLGKTTLVKTVYDKIKGKFNCCAFVSVGRNADPKKILMDILLDLGMEGGQLTMLDETRLINKLRESLEKKRYLIVIDDIWDEKLWTTINWAFSKANEYGSRLITTTRIFSVSKLCCSSTNDSVYHMEPLSDDDSRRLFHKRIFSQESGCPREFKEVSEDILKKCGGVPLAIITIASVLASDERANSLNEWLVLLESIGRGLNEDPSVEEMMRILSFSYYDLPSHLKTCLLYLSLFPEDSEIMKDRLIWMWIAESFVQCGKANTSLFEVGETYFNELVNRNLIQPVYNSDGFVHACRVHDSVLDLICSLSSEENLVTIVNGTGGTMCSQGIVRRLSLQNAIKEDQTGPLRSESIQQVRSVVTFAPAIYLMPALSSFVVLRVLDLDGYDGNEDDHLNLGELGRLLHLRYLRLSGKAVNDLPEEMGKLQYLQVVHFPGGTILPSTVIKLTRLMCLRINCRGSGLPEGIGNLTSMEVLGMIKVDSVSIVKELGNMEKMKELIILFESLGLVEAFVESLAKMQKIQHVDISADCEFEVSMDLLVERWVPRAILREFIMHRGVRLSTLPAWNPYHLSRLSRLEISVGELGQEDLGFLGRFPALQVLMIKSDNQRLLLFGTEGFSCLKVVNLVSSSPNQILFQSGALPKAEQVSIDISCVRVQKEEAAGIGTDLIYLSMINLPSLRMARVTLYCSGATVAEAKEAKTDLELTLLFHHNRPHIEIKFNEDIPEDARDEDVYIKKVEGQESV